MEAPHLLFHLWEAAFQGNHNRTLQHTPPDSSSRARGFTWSRFLNWGGLPLEDDDHWYNIGRQFRLTFSLYMARKRNTNITRATSPAFSVANLDGFASSPQIPFSNNHRLRVCLQLVYSMQEHRSKGKSVVGSRWLLYNNANFIQQHEQYGVKQSCLTLTTMLSAYFHPITVG